MYLKTLHLRQFRNYLDQTVEFGAPKTVLLGDNAQGKSNLLESVELLSTLRSHRTSRDRDLIYTGKPIAQVAAQLERDIGSIDLSCTLRLNSRRTVAINSEAVRRQIDFLGILNMVQFSSLDLDLVRGGPEQRRNWLDGLLIQLEPIYAHILQQYNQVLRQRNALLKNNQRPAISGQQSGQTEPRFDPNLEHPTPHTPHPTPHTLLPSLLFGMPSLPQPEHGSFDGGREFCSGWLP